MFVELSPFQWALQHAQLLQWPTVAVVVYYFAKYLEHAKTVALKDSGSDQYDGDESLSRTWKRP
jgi:hypothetical protein